jgi:PmbA protein
MGRELGARDVIGLVRYYRRQMLRFSNNTITVVKTWDEIIPIVYLAVEGKRMTGVIDDPRPEALKDVIKRLMEVAPKMRRDEIDSRIPEGPFKYEEIESRYDPRISDIDEEMVDLAEAAINGALSEGALRSAGAIIATEWRKIIRTSTGVEGEDRGTRIEMSVRAFSNGDASGQGNSCATTLAGFDPEGAGRRAGEIASLARNPTEGSEGRFKAVLAPAVMANLLNRVAESASAFNVDIGMSFFSGKLNQKVASESLTLIDDGRLPAGPFSEKFDDEGYPTRRTPLIQEGILRSYLHNSYTAMKYSSSLTGSTLLAGGVYATPHNIIVEPGSLSDEKLLEELDDGLYVTNNWYTRFQNYQTGDFSTICRDAVFRIKNGEIYGSLKNLRISDNMLRIIRSIQGLSRERVWIKWWEVETPVFLPHILVDNLQVTRAEI